MYHKNMTNPESTNQEKHHKTNTKASRPNPSLPEELILEILQWLPVITLLQFRSVSRLWLSLISSLDFIKTHVSKSVKDPNFTHSKLILSSTNPHFNIKNCCVNELLNGVVCEAVEVDYPMKNPHNSVWIVGCCNGLVCLAIEEDSLFLWNPAMRKSRRLRSCEMNLRYGCYIVYGFGYDESEDDFKVVGIFCVFRNVGTYETEVKIYSSKSDVWRRIEEFPFGIPLDDSGKFANGALHWAASRDIRSDSPDSWIIVSLDVKRERYGEVAQPKYGDGTYNLTLGILDRCLCVLCNYESTRADVWVMKEYGVKESWTKLVSIPYVGEPSVFQYSVPLCISANGDILVELGSRILLYNFKDNVFKDVEIANFEGCLEADTYVESLVSPHV
ncbi:F-box/kelch-repeat protein At3g23880-like [Apium graveolens]|uniref:F-box/kelch-repeat protein At3g23880-like n=1 Tax=Apium graveolens TaxID=4045 RepID=UPI003D7B8D96